MAATAPRGLEPEPEAEPDADHAVSLSRREIIHEIRGKLLASFDKRSATVGFLSGERQVAKELGVSRVPIRESLTVLRAHGVIVVDQELRQYRACVVPLIGEPIAPPIGANGLPTTPFQILERELLGDVRTLIAFIADGRHGGCSPGPNPIEKLNWVVRDLKCFEVSEAELASAIIRINDLVAEAARALGLGRTADSIRTHLDILEFSVAAARRELLAPRQALDGAVFGSRLVRQRAHGLTLFFDACLREELDSGNYIEDRLKQFRAYIDCVRKTVTASDETAEPPRPKFADKFRNLVTAAAAPAVWRARIPGA